MNRNYLNELITKLEKIYTDPIIKKDEDILQTLKKLKSELKAKELNSITSRLQSIRSKLDKDAHDQLKALVDFFVNNPNEQYPDDESTTPNANTVSTSTNGDPVNDSIVHDCGNQQQDSNPTQGQTKSNENHAGNSKEEKPPSPVPTQPTAHITQNQFELGIALGILQKETNSLKEYLNNILARQRDTDASINNQIEHYRNIQNNMGILSETIKNIEPILIKITPEISRAAKETKETLVNALADEKLIKRVTEYQTDVDAMLKKIRDTTNADIDDLYKVVRKSAGTIIDETLGQSQKTIVDSAVKAVETATATTDKKYTNLIMFGLLGCFVCGLLTSAFTAKLVATYSSNNTIEYITKLLNEAADKNKEQQQVKKSKK